jgi:protein-tyrosine phosphatase
MIDIHSHVLPGFDDGPVSIEESLDMLRLAEEDGIQTVISTPHSAFLVGKRYGKSQIEAATAMLQQQSQSANIQVQVRPGIEVHFTGDIEQNLADGIAFTLAGSRYLLLELSFYSYPFSVEPLLAALRRRGLIPILAHPERLEYFQQDPNLLRKLIKLGALVQLTADSLTGGFGPASQTMSRIMLEHGWAHFLASDAHDNGHRAPRLSEALATAAEMIGYDAARALVVTHPQAVLDDADIVAEEPLRYGPRHHWFVR